MPRRALLLALLLTLLAPAGASATQRTGSGSDPAGDGPAPARDITSAQITADDVAGTVSAKVVLVGAPAMATRAFLAVTVGTRSGTTCSAPYALLGTNTDSGDGVYARDGATQPYPVAPVVRDGAAITISASGADLQGLAPDCVDVRVVDGAQTTTVYDRLDALAALTPVDTDGDGVPDASDACPQVAAATTNGCPPSAPPPPTTTTTSTAPPTTPPVPKAAKLAVQLSGAPTVARRGRTLRLRARVRNDGAKAATGVRFKVLGARGLSAHPSVTKLGTLKAGTARTVSLPTRLTSRARTTTRLTVVVTGSPKLSTRSTVVLSTRKPATTAKSNPLVGTLWWTNVVHVNYAWDNRGLYFVNDRFVYRGLPHGALPTCTAATAGPDPSEDKDDGCVPYTYDAKTRALTIGGVPGTFTGTEIKTHQDEDVSFEPLLLAKPGQRFGIEQVHTDFTGQCGFFAGCSISKKYLTLAADGQFVFSRDSAFSSGDPINGPYVTGGSAPPDQHGTYEILPTGQIHFAFADGTTKLLAFSIQTKDGKADPTGEGVVLDEDNFYPDP